jgi:hypothetical protein
MNLTTALLKKTFDLNGRGPILSEHGQVYSSATGCPTITGTELLDRIIRALQLQERLEAAVLNMTDILEGQEETDAQR